MKRSKGAIRMALAGMVLVGGALAIFGDLKHETTDRSIAVVPGTNHAWVAPLPRDGTSAGVARVLLLAARGRSEDADPCVPITPVGFSARGAAVC